MDKLERFCGCMIASATGDALGAPVEFKDIAAIREQFGEKGITDLAVAYGRLGAITDDTQMAMATARALVDARTSGRDALDCLRERYVEWRVSQKNPRNMRGPGMTCLAALEEQMERPSAVADNDSKGCGGVMRVHPVGLFLAGRPEEAFELGWRSADLSHGHQTSSVSSGAQAALVSLLAAGEEPATAIRRVTSLLEERDQNRETIALFGKAVGQAVIESSDPEIAIRTLGEGWVAEEALAIGVYSFLHHLADPFEALVVSVNH